MKELWGPLACFFLENERFFRTPCGLFFKEFEEISEFARILISEGFERILEFLSIFGVLGTFLKNMKMS